MSKRIALLFILVFAFALILFSCRSRNENTPVASQTTPLPTAASPLPSSPVPTETPAEKPVQPTRVPLPTATPQPTNIPAPYLGESVMGIELVGKDFGKWAVEAAGLGAYWIRWNGILWSDIEPAPGDRRWETQSIFEQQIRVLNEQGLRYIAIVRSAPPWAQAIPGTFCGPIASESLAAYGDFLFDLVSRYKDEPYNIKYWELGNEPDIDPRFVRPLNQFGCWGDEDDAYYGGGYYAEMLKAIWPRIKAADPEAQILVGGLLLDCDPVNPPETSPGSGVARDCKPARFLQGILENGGGDYFDGVSFHAYDYYDPANVAFGNLNWHVGVGQDGLRPVLVPKTRFIKSTLAEYGYSDKLLFNTEISVLCGRIGNEPECTNGLFDRTKAAYVPMAYAAAIAEGLEGNLWFTLTDSWRRSQLLRSNGGSTEASEAYKIAHAQLDGADYWGIISEFPQVTGYKFRRGPIEIWVVWSLDGAEHSIEISTLPDEVLDFLGESQEPALNLLISKEPLYLVWSP